MTAAPTTDRSHSWPRSAVGGVISAVDAALLAVLGASLGHSHAISYLLLIGYLPIVLVPAVWDLVESPIVFALVTGSIFWFINGFVITYRSRTAAEALWKWLLLFLLLGSVGLLILQLSLLFP